jgi:hypothetical protein
MIWGEDSQYGRRKAVETPTRQDIGGVGGHGTVTDHDNCAQALLIRKKHSAGDFHCVLGRILQ